METHVCIYIGCDCETDVIPITEIWLKPEILPLLPMDFVRETHVKPSLILRLWFERYNPFDGEIAGVKGLGQDGLGRRRLFGGTRVCHSVAATLKLSYLSSFSYPYYTPNGLIAACHYGKFIYRVGRYTRHILNPVSSV